MMSPDNGAPTAARPEGWPPSVLVAEDNAVNTLVVQQMLERLGITPTFATTGVAAVAAWQAARPQVLLMDLFMPEMDGIAATHRIRALERETGGPRTAIVALTASAAPSDRQRCLAAGMDLYLAKPFTLEQLLGALTAGVRGLVEVSAAPGWAEAEAPRKVLDLVQVEAWAATLPADELAATVTLCLDELAAAAVTLRTAGEAAMLAGQADAIDTLAQPLGLSAVAAQCATVGAAVAAGDLPAARAHAAVLADLVNAALDALSSWLARRQP